MEANYSSAKDSEVFYVPPKSQSIAAASIIAKVTRDRMMDELDQKYPQYLFKKNKGYGTKAHIEAIRNYGIIDEHRKSFAPCSEYVK